jgi:hypothetical protein
MKTVMACPGCGGRGVVYLPSLRHGAPKRKVGYHNECRQYETVEVPRLYPVPCMQCLCRGTFMVEMPTVSDRDKMECEKIV